MERRAQKGPDAANCVVAEESLNRPASYGCVPEYGDFSLMCLPWTAFQGSNRRQDHNASGISDSGACRTSRLHRVWAHLPRQELLTSGEKADSQTKCGNF